MLMLALLAPLSLAQDAAPAAPAAEKPAPQLYCNNVIKQNVADKTKAMANFVTQHFKNGSSTTELLPDATERFRQYVRDVKKELADYPVRDKTLGPELLKDRTACEEFVNDQLFMVKALIKSHVKQSAQAKKTTKLLNAFKEINGKLDKLNFDMAQMYANMQTFSQKLPCYANQCN